MARAAYKPPEVSPRIERERKEKAEKRDLMRQQVADGSLIIRPMTNVERLEWGLPTLPKESLGVADVRSLWELRAQGKQRVEIAEILGTTVNVVRNVISRRGIYAGREFDPRPGTE